MPVEERGDFDGEIREGDMVFIRGGEFNGCILTVKRIEPCAAPGKRWYVCSRTTPPYEVRTTKVEFYRRPQL